MAHMRPSTASKLIELLKSDPQMRAAYAEVNGLAGGATDDAIAAFGGLTEENVARGLDLVAQANALFFRVGVARFAKHPFIKDDKGRPQPIVIEPDILDAAFRLTPKQHAELDPRATRLAQKYSSELPDWLKRNLDLYMLGSMFLFYTAQNAKTALETQLKRDLARLQHAHARAQANPPHNPKPDTDAAQPINGHDWTPPPMPQTDAPPVHVEPRTTDNGRPLV